jgi:DNA modification methylase
MGCFCACTAWRGVLGLEPTPELYVAHLVEVFREVRRVLRDDGTCWLNLGDSYAGSGMTGGTDSLDGAASRVARMFHGNHRDRLLGLKPKDLVGIPWRVAFALQADGWWLRSDIIWAKPNPMPESITDRPTKAHEYLFLLTKAARYYYDGEAIKEAAIYAGDVKHGLGSTKPFDDVRQATLPRGERLVPDFRNRRSVWTIATEPYPEAHFATFPEKLIEPCILAGTSERGACPICGAPWAREVDRAPAFQAVKRMGRDDMGASSQMRALVPGPDRYMSGRTHAKHKSEYPDQFLGWSPSCACPPAEPVLCRVLDPFAGSGTTVAVAERLGRVGIGVELKPAYLRLGWARTRQMGLL